jgi:DNA-directed RNA polymerase II subunit RPB11
MSNIPNPLDSILLPENRKKIKILKDTEIKNCHFYKIEREDHTLGNLIHSQLLNDKNILFSGYRKPHPLEHFIIFKIITDGTVSPNEALDCALKDIYIELTQIEDLLNKF